MWGWGGMPYGPLSSESPEAPKGILPDRAGRRCVCGGLTLACSGGVWVAGGLAGAEPQLLSSKRVLA